MGDGAFSFEVDGAEAVSKEDAAADVMVFFRFSLLPFDLAALFGRKRPVSD